MAWLSRSGRLIVGAVLVMAVCRFSAADEYQNYPPPRPLAGEPDPPTPLPQHGPSHWAGEVAEPPSNPPRYLSAGYEAQEIGSQTVGGSSHAGPAAVETAASSQPIPLSRRSSDAPSPLGKLTGGDTAPLVDAATSLGIVLGLFLLVAWAVRRGMPKGSGLLPTEAVEVLGRASLAGRQQVHLVRCGSKIVLLSITPGGAQTLAEISDPAEVDRLYSVCQPAGTTGGAWRQFFAKFTGQSRGAEYYTRAEAESLDFRHLETPLQHHA